MPTVTKVIPHSAGLSCTFRQWRAQSHCRYLHGYALQIEFTIFAPYPTDEGWVFDFGQFKEIRSWLADQFDHKLVIAEDDPHKVELISLGSLGLADVRILPAVGCEAFAAHIHNHAALMIKRASCERAELKRTTVFEHESNSATYPGKPF